MTDYQSAILEILAEDRRTISYRPQFTELTDDTMSAILLQQMLFYAKEQPGVAFYKFRDICKHKDYRSGDSWCERLSWKTTEFDNALEKIATKVTKGKSKSDLLAIEYPERLDGESNADFLKRFKVALAACVLYWTDSNRVTWYLVNMDLLGKFINQIYLDKSKGLRYLVKLTNRDTYKNRKSQDTLLEESIQTDSKQDTDIEDVAPIGAENEPSAFEPFIETELFEESKEQTNGLKELEAYDLAVCYFFGIKHPTQNNNKGWSHVRKMGNFFRGKIGQDKPNDAFKEFQFKEEPFTPLEIIAMRIWWTDQFDDISMLQKPATIAEKETIFRPTYDEKLEARAQRRLEKEAEKVFGIKPAEQPAKKLIPVDVEKTSALIADLAATLD